MSLRKFLRNSFFTLLAGFFCLFILDKIFPPYLTRVLDLSPHLLDQKGELLFVGLSKDEKWRLPISYEVVDKRFLDALVLFEDRYFFYHLGINPLSLCRAFGQLVSHGRVLSGGSTLTMQTVRLLEPRRRTFVSKILEIFRALQLEYHFSKRKILEMYLTLAPFGRNVEGVRCGSLLYFGKEPTSLTLPEIAFLVSLPQSPNLSKKDATKAKNQRRKVLNRLLAYQKITARQVKEAEGDSLPSFSFALPRSAAHLYSWLQNRYPSQKKFATSLDQTLQKRVEAYFLSLLPTFEEKQTCAALIVDNQTKEVLAYVGSAAFGDEKRQGYVDMIQAIKSPGSTLKPFIYALGFEEGILHPETYIEDRPTRFGTYTPSNFHHTFYGTVTIREALQKSLNIPAVSILEKIGPNRFMGQIQHLGITCRLEKEHQNSTLPIALGGVGISLYDLVSLYVSLANPLENKGNFYPLQVLKRVSKAPDCSKSTPFLNTVSAWYVTDILEGVPPPIGFMDREASGRRPVAYKTGTSYGFRDAWTVLYNDRYTVGIWVGRPDGTPVMNQYGSRTAAPLAFNIFNLLPPVKTSAVRSPPEGVLMTTNGQLPPNLKDFKREKEGREGSAFLSRVPSLKIVFPIEDTSLVLEEEKTEKRGQNWRPIPLVIEGGTAPYYYFAGDLFLTSQTGLNQVLWHPKAPGFTKITVLDSAGQGASITVRVKVGGNNSLEG